MYYSLCATMPSCKVICTLLLCNFVVSNAFLTSLFGGHGIKNNIDVVCVMEHCGSQSASCMSDSNCRSNMVCMAECGLSNTTCIYRCMGTYEDTTFDTMMKCLVDDFHCMELPAPDPTFRCSPPTQLVKNFTLSQLEGSWWVVMGMNPVYDCFDCQLSTYTPMRTSNNYSLEVTFDVAMLNGSARRISDNMQLQQTNPSNGGLLDYTNKIMGLTMYEQWQILDYAASGNYVIIYYCGHITPNWSYEGGLVYSRNATLSAEDTEAVADFLNAMGRDVSDYCKPNTWLCH